MHNCMALRAWVGVCSSLGAMVFLSRMSVMLACLLPETPFYLLPSIYGLVFTVRIYIKGLKEMDCSSTEDLPLLYLVRYVEKKFRVSHQGFVLLAAIIVCRGVWHVLFEKKLINTMFVTGTVVCCPPMALQRVESASVGTFFCSSEPYFLPWLGSFKGCAFEVMLASLWYGQYSLCPGGVDAWAR